MNPANKRGRKKKDPDYNNVFSVRLRELIKEKNVTQQEISEKITASRQALNKWVNGETIPDILAAAELADYFEVSLDYLTGRGTTKSSNEDITITRNVTGLTEEAINKLQLINNNKEMYTPERINFIHPEFESGLGYYVFNVPSAIDIISNLIESHIFEILIGDIQVYCAMSHKNNSILIDKEEYEEIKNNPILSTYNYYITPSIIAETKLNHASDCVKKMITDVADKKEAQNNGEHNPSEE